MNKYNLNSDPPFLQGIYLRDDFDLSLVGSAFEALPDLSVEQQPAEPEPTHSALMSDDDFLNSLTSPDLKEEVLEAEIDAPESSPVFRESPEVSRQPRSARFPFSLPWMNAEFELNFPGAVTFLVGENGSGKSTLIEAIASLCGFPISGGGTNDLTDRFGPERDSELAHAMYPNFRKRHRDGYFFRAEYHAHFASLLDQRKCDPDFMGNPYSRYGGKSLHHQSHGESFLSLLQNRFTSGLFLLDEPESALSPQRQLTLLAMIADRIKDGKSQFIIATHSPILMTYPGARIISFDSQTLEEVELEETSHYTLTRGILDNPEMYWQHLLP